MNLASLPYYLPSPWWLLLCVVVGIIASLLYGATANVRAENRRVIRRAAELTWPEYPGKIFRRVYSDGKTPVVSVVVEVIKGPDPGHYQVPVSPSLYASVEIGQPLRCRLGRYPGQKSDDPPTCVIEQML